MEEVRRQIYEKCYNQIQQKRYKQSKNIYLDNYEERMRKKSLEKAIQNTQTSPSTKQTYRVQIKSLSKHNKVKLKYQNSVQFTPNSKKTQNMRISTLRFPQIHSNNSTHIKKYKSNNKRNLRLVFKKIVNSMIFIHRLQKQSRKSLFKRKIKIQKLCQNVPNMVNRLLINYYDNLLSQELKNYIQILNFQLDHPQIEVTDKIIQMLYSISLQLKKSSLTEQFINFLSQISTNHAFIPSQFMFQFEINRLQFSNQFGCITNTSVQQSEMIIGLCLGIKILCPNILYKPWLLLHSSKELIQYFSKLRKLIWNIGSIFYFIIKDFYINLQQIKIQQKINLNKFKIKPSSKINIYPKNYQQQFDKNTINQFIPNQNRKFYQKVNKQYTQSLNKIEKNLKLWIQRITHATLKYHKKKILKQKKQKFRFQQK